MIEISLLEKVNHHLQVTKQNPTAFGVAAIGDPNFVFDLRNGRECRQKTKNKVLKYISLSQNNHPTEKLKNHAEGPREFLHTRQHQQEDTNGTHT